MVKYCKFKESIVVTDEDGNKTMLFQEGQQYLVIAEVEEGEDNTGYKHKSAYYFPNGLGIEKKHENKLYEVVEVENEI